MQFLQKQTPILQNKRNHSKLAFIFLLPSLSGVLIFVLIPFLDVVRRSFYEAMGKKAVGFANYRLIFENKSFQQAVFNTVHFLAVCIPLLVIVSLVIALLVQGAGQGSELFKTIFLLPLAVPIASVVVLWKLVFHEAGYLNRMLEVIQIEGRDWMNEKEAFYILVFSYLWKNIGYDMVLWLAGLHGIAPSLYEAAKVDGAGKWTCFYYITLPNLKTTVFMVIVLSFINSFKVFREAYLVAGDYPQESIYLLQHLFNNWFVSLDVHKMSAAAVVMASAIMVVLYLLQKISDREERETI